MKGFSIIICTYNGKLRLYNTLYYISKLKIDINFGVELIFVDNNSTDGTTEYVKSVADTLNFDFELIYVKEIKQGKPFAFKKGFLCSKYSYILVCDDDNWLSDDYLLKCFKILESDSSIGLLVGKPIPVFEGAEPKIVKFFKKQFVLFPPFEDSCYFHNKREFIYGAGSVLRSSVLKYIFDSGFSFVLGKGFKKAVGEDTELSFVINKLGYRFYYSHDITFHHFMPISRFKYKSLSNSFKGFGLNWPLIIYYKYLFNKSYGSPSIRFFLIKYFFLFLYDFFKNVFRYFSFQRNQNDRIIIKLNLISLSNSICMVFFSFFNPIKFKIVFNNYKRLF